MDSVYKGGWARGGEVGVGDGWEAEGGLYHPLEQEQGGCVLDYSKYRNRHSVHVRSRRLLAAV